MTTGITLTDIGENALHLVLRLRAAFPEILTGIASNTPTITDTLTPTMATPLSPWNGRQMALQFGKYAGVGLALYWGIKAVSARMFQGQETTKTTETRCFLNLPFGYKFWCTDYICSETKCSKLNTLFNNCISKKECNRFKN